METALDVFSRRGLEGTRTKEIASEAGISETLIFQHFNTKKDLYQAILLRIFDHHPVYPDVERSIMSRDDNGVFLGVATHIVVHMRKDPRVIRFLYYAMLQGEMGDSIVRKEDNIPGPFMILKEYIQSRVNEGVFSEINPTITAYLFIQSICIYLVDSEIPHEPVMSFSDSDVIQTIVSIYVKGLKPL